MEEKKSVRQAGSKVSQIANIFQSRQPIREEILAPVKSTNKTTRDKNEMDSPSVTVMRTESHVTRFNNARALFEKLGEENRSRSDRMVPLQSTKSASNILDLRSRSSSANSETRDTKSHDGSRSPSPNRNNQLDKLTSNSVPVLNANVKANGFNNAAEQVPDNSLDDSAVVKLNGNEVVVKCAVSEDRTINNIAINKPVVMKKPEKPERKFNSKELIEKQRNWTSHFTKTRSSRYHSDPSKTDVKLAVSNGSRETSGDNRINSASRSASFNNKIRSPPTSPPPPPDVTRRTNIVRRERPASVIPTTTPTKKDSTTPSPKSISSPTRREKTASLIFTNKEDSPTRVIASNTYRVTKPHFKREEKDNKENELETNKDNKIDYVASPTKSASRSSSQDSLLHQAVVANAVSNKFASEEKEASRENLSGTSGSLSSLSPPSSPSRVKTENEKQEDERNEKSEMQSGKLFFFYKWMFTFIRTMFNNLFRKAIWFYDNGLNLGFLLLKNCFIILLA